MAEYNPNVNRINKRNIENVLTITPNVERINKRKREKELKELEWHPFREPLQKLVKPFEKVEKGIERFGKRIIEKPSPETWKGVPTYMYKKGVPTEKESKLLEKPTYEIYTKPPYVRTKQLEDITLKGEVKKATSNMLKDIGYHFKPYLPWKWTEPEGVVGKTIAFTEKAIDSTARFLADPSEYDEEGNPTLFPQIRATALLGYFVVEAAIIGGGMKVGLAYRKSMQTFEKWRKTLGQRKLKVEFDRYLKSQKFKDVQRNMRTFFERVTKWFRRKPRPVGEKLGREIRVRGRMPEVGKKELFATKEEIAIKNIERTLKQSGEVTRNLRRAGFEVERPARSLKTEQKPFITDNVIVVKNIPTAEGGEGVALLNTETFSVHLFKNPIELKQEILRLAMDSVITPEKEAVEKVIPPKITQEGALKEIKTIMPRVRELSTHITASKSIGREIEPETYTELERLNDRVSELMPVAYPKPTEKVRPIPEVAPPPAKIPTRMTVGEARERLKELGYTEEEIRKIKKPSELFRILREKIPPTKVAPSVPGEVIPKPEVKPEVVTFFNTIKNEFDMTDPVELFPTTHGKGFHRIVDGVHQLGVNMIRSFNDVKGQIIHEMAHSKGLKGEEFWRQVDKVATKYGIEEWGLKVIPKPEAIKVEEAKPGIPRGWKIIQDTEWVKKYKTYEGTLEIDISKGLAKGGLRKFTFRIKKIGRKTEIRARNLEEAIEKYKLETGAVEVYERAELRKLEKYEINRVLTDLSMTAMKIPPTDADIKSSLETVMGALSEEEIRQALKDVKLYTEKPTEESIQGIYDGGIEEDKRSYSEQYDRMRELLNRWNDLTGDEKEEFSRLGDTVIRRVVDSAITLEEYMGFPIDEIEETRKESALQAAFSSLAGVLDLHAKFPKWARKSAIAVKRVWNTGEMMNKKGIWINRKLNKAGKLYNAKRGDYIDAFIPASQRALLKDFPPGQKEMYERFFKILDGWFEEELVTLKKKGIVEKGFIERVKWEAREKIQHYKAARNKAKTIKQKVSFDELISQERELLDFIKNMDVKYVHLPIRLLLEQLMDNQDIKNYLKFSRFFRRRETIDVATWVKELRNKWYPTAVRNTRAVRKEIEEGKARLVKGNIEIDKELGIERPVLDKNMLDIRRIVAAYAHKLGRLYGLADIVNAFQSDGLIKDLPLSGIAPEKYTMLPAKYFPEFKGKIAMRVAADWLEAYLDTVYKPRSRTTQFIDRFFGYFKLMQFTIPFFMPAYDVYQASIHWGLRWALMKPHKVPGVIKKAIKSFVTKDSYYWDFWNYGGPSKPFTAPWKSYMGDIEILTQDTGIQKLLQFVKSHHITTLVDAAYIPIWNANWGGDELIRLISYHAMLEEGHIPEEAAQLAATIHSDYARMPVSTRRILNKIFFVPVFPFTMAVWEYQMMEAAVLESMRLGAKGLGKVFPPMKKLEAKLTPTADEMFKRRKSMAKGLLGLLMIVALRESMQKALGFKRDVIGLRYVKEIPDPDDPRMKKELVKYIPTPDNVLLRHIFRWSGFLSEPDKVDYFARKSVGILHPLLALPVEMAMNRKRDYTPITDMSQVWDGPSGWAKMGLDYLSYAGERLIRILQSIPGLATEYREERKKAIREFRKDVPVIARILERFCFLYIRNTKDVRGRRRAKDWHRLMMQEIREEERRTGRPLTEKEIRRRIERHRKMEDALLDITGGRIERKISPTTYEPNVGRINRR